MENPLSGGREDNDGRAGFWLLEGDPNELGQRLRELQRETERRRRIKEQNRIAKVIWVYGVLPLPVVYYSRIYQRFRGGRAQEYLLRFVQFVSVWLMKLMRAITVLIIASGWFRQIFNMFMAHASAVTYSDNFLKDIFTFILRDHSAALLDRKAMWGPQPPPWLLYHTLHQFVLDVLARMLSADCAYALSPLRDQPVTDKNWCKINKNSLIFKLAEILEVKFPALQLLSPWVLTTVTVVVYLTYGIVGQYVCLNVLSAHFTNIGFRSLPFFKFVGKLAKLMWSTPGNPVL